MAKGIREMREVQVHVEGNFLVDSFPSAFYLQFMRIAFSLELITAQLSMQIEELMWIIRTNFTSGIHLKVAEMLNVPRWKIALYAFVSQIA